MTDHYFIAPGFGECIQIQFTNANGELAAYMDEVKVRKGAKDKHLGEEFVSMTRGKPENEMITDVSLGK